MSSFGFLGKYNKEPHGKSKPYTEANSCCAFPTLPIPSIPPFRFVVFFSFLFIVVLEKLLCTHTSEDRLFTTMVQGIPDTDTTESVLNLTQGHIQNEIRQQFLNQPYPNLPLRGQQIRLISLSPARRFNAPVHCQIFRVQLSESSIPPYEALSYVWGSFSDATISMNNMNCYTVTDNLTAALRHLRGRKKPRLLWIDAICIDQNNLDERNCQVGMMRDIYARADRVIVWLGHPSQDMQGEMTRASGLVESLTMHRYHAWWRRMWTLQEVAGNQNRIVYYGKREITWDDFLSMFISRSKLLSESRRTLHQTRKIWSRKRTQRSVSANSPGLQSLFLDTLKAFEGLKGVDIPGGHGENGFFVQKHESVRILEIRSLVFLVLSNLSRPNCS